jgi:hypothetical protein
MRYPAILTLVAALLAGCVPHAALAQERSRISVTADSVLPEGVYSSCREAPWHGESLFLRGQRFRRISDDPRSPEEGRYSTLGTVLLLHHDTSTHRPTRTRLIVRVNGEVMMWDPAGADVWLSRGELSPYGLLVRTGDEPRTPQREADCSKILGIGFVVGSPVGVPAAALDAPGR